MRRATSLTQCCVCSRSPPMRQHWVCAGAASSKKLIAGIPLRRGRNTCSRSLLSAVNNPAQAWVKLNMLSDSRPSVQVDTATRHKHATGARTVDDRRLQGTTRNRRPYRILYRGVDEPEVVHQL